MALIQVNYLSNALARTVPVNVILPADKVDSKTHRYARRDRPFKTLYLLHGMFGNYTDWCANTRVQRWAEERNLAVVMPSGDNSMYLDQGVDFYGEFVGKEIVEFTRKTFPLSRKREDTYIGGLSMGGFGAMRNGLKYHETFGAIISLSGAYVLDEETLIEVENPMFAGETTTYKKRVYGDDLEAALISDRNPKYLIETLSRSNVDFPEIYMACGTEDFLLEKNRRIDQLLTDCGVNHTFVTGPGSHEWDFWDTYILKALEWLPLESGAAGKSSENIGK